MNYELHHWDCLEVMPTLSAGSVHLIAVDLPYFGVKDNDWDNAWANRDAFLAWVGRVCDEWKRLLAPNGSVYAFASPQMAWHVEGVIRDRFNVLSNIRWQKPPFATKAEMFDKEAMRAPFPASETIIFAEKMQKWPQMLTDARLKSGYSRQEIAEKIVGTRSGACWNWEAGIRFPEQHHWEKLSSVIGGLPPYDDIERPFNATPDAPYTDVWTFPTVQAYPGKHPTEKPIALMEHIVGLSSRPGDTVLDCCMGHGTTGIAAGNLGRKFVGIEQDAGYFEEASRRIAAAYKDWDKARKVRKGRATDTADLPLFAR